MARHRKIITAIWDDPDFQALTPHGRLVFIFLFGSAHASESGIYHITPKTIADRTGVRRVEVETLLGGGMKNVYYDAANSAVFVARFRKHQASSGGRPDLIAAAIAGDREATGTVLWRLFDHLYDEYGESRPGADIPAAIVAELELDKPLHARSETGTAAARQAGLFAGARPGRPRVKISPEATPDILAIVDKVVAEFERCDIWPTDAGFKENERSVVAEMIRDFPRLNHPAIAKDMVAWLLTNPPTKKNWNALLRIRNWWRIAAEKELMRSRPGRRPGAPPRKGKMESLEDM